MVETMKALVFTAPYTFEYRDVPCPHPAPDEVLVEVKACAICGSGMQQSRPYLPSSSIIRRAYLPFVDTSIISSEKHFMRSFTLDIIVGKRLFVNINIISDRSVCRPVIAGPIHI